MMPQKFPFRSCKWRQNQFGARICCFGHFKPHFTKSIGWGMEQNKPLALIGHSRIAAVYL
jgi:hypothetical protein